MGLTTERKVFFGLMVIAGASLIVDQAILSPKSASADSLDVTQIEAMPNQPILAGLTKPITKSVTQILNDRLSNANLSSNVKLDASDIQNMFTPIVKPTQPIPTLPQQTSLSQPSSEKLPAQEAPSDLPLLSAVMPSRSGQSGAILDATLYRIGETTRNGYRLISVEQRQVVVEKNGHEYWIILPAFKD
jgi:hypothetical protein